jgi:2,3-bisphosphoglycerate-dependent phosphoglycerate mutase
MAVGIQLGSITDEIGTDDFFHAFFSTISGNLETEGWGSRFPILLKKLYGGELQQMDAIAALTELDQIRKELAQLPVSKVIWDVEHREKMPPWGTNISVDITDLSNYFVTSTGRDLVGVLKEVLEELRDRGGGLKVVNV